MRSHGEAELEQRMGDHAQDASTVSSTSQQTTQYSEQHKVRTQDTAPTSQPSDSFHPAGKDDINPTNEEFSHTQPNRIDSNEAQYGSDSLHSSISTESSSGASDDSRKKLPHSTRGHKMKEIGGHFPDTIPRDGPPLANVDGDNEAPYVAERINLALAITRAADTSRAHLQPDSTPEMYLPRDQISGSWVTRGSQPTSIHQTSQGVDVNRQQHILYERSERVKATIFVLAVVVLVAVLSFTLYANLYIVQ